MAVDLDLAPTMISIDPINSPKILMGPTDIADRPPVLRICLQDISGLFLMKSIKDICDYEITGNDFRGFVGFLLKFIRTEDLKN